MDVSSRTRRKVKERKSPALRNIRPVRKSRVENAASTLQSVSLAVPVVDLSEHSDDEAQPLGTNENLEVPLEVKDEAVIAVVEGSTKKCDSSSFLSAMDDADSLESYRSCEPPAESLVSSRPPDDTRSRLPTRTTRASKKIEEMKTTPNNNVAPVKKMKKELNSKVEELADPCVKNDNSKEETGGNATISSGRLTRAEMEPVSLGERKYSEYLSPDDAKKVTLDDFSGSTDTIEDIQTVKRHIQLYNAYCDEAMKTERARISAIKANLNLDTKSSKRATLSKRSSLPEKRTEEVILAQRASIKAKAEKIPVARPDLVAVKRMKEDNILLFKGSLSVIGRIRGIIPGDQFFSRCELSALGIHKKWLSGIDFLSAKASPYGVHVCTCICISGGYEDDEDRSTEIEYTGQGGNDLLGKKGQFKDQEMKDGNLALKNSIEIGNPVRVIRGHKSRDVTTYTFDGMYKVVDYYEKVGQSGFLVYKFKLTRLEGQPQLTTDQVKFICGKGVPKSVDDCEGVVCHDLSNGLENLPIVATNTIDKDKTLPPPFEYIANVRWPKSMKPPKPGKGCDCTDQCEPATCQCADPVTREFNYIDDKARGKRLTFARGVVVECGPNCGCSDDCRNRNAQLGLRFRLEVYKTANKGWAVRSWDHIPAGAIIAPYVGEVVHESELTDFDTYVLDLDAVKTAMVGGVGREAKYGDIEARIRQIRKPEVCQAGNEVKSPGQCEWALDAGRAGNFVRFVNHSCDPNLFYQPTLWDHSDLEFAHPVLVAAQNIPPMTELTYDYNYTIGSVTDDNGKVVKLPCYCGTTSCRKRLY